MHGTFWLAYVLAAVVHLFRAAPVGVLRGPCVGAEPREAEQMPVRAVQVTGTEHRGVLFQYAIALARVYRNSRRVFFTGHAGLLFSVSAAAMGGHAIPPAAVVGELALQ